MICPFFKKLCLIGDLCSTLKPHKNEGLFTIKVAFYKKEIRKKGYKLYDDIDIKLNKRRLETLKTCIEMTIIINRIRMLSDNVGQFDTYEDEKFHKLEHQCMEFSDIVMNDYCAINYPITDNTTETNVSKLYDMLEIKKSYLREVTQFPIGLFEYEPQRGGNYEKFDWNKFKYEHISVWCKTEEEMDDFLNKAFDNGLLWHNHANALCGKWKTYKEKTCFTSCGDGCLYHLNLAFAKKQEYEVIEWDKEEYEILQSTPNSILFSINEDGKYDIDFTFPVNSEKRLEIHAPNIEFDQPLNFGSLFPNQFDKLELAMKNIPDCNLEIKTSKSEASLIKKLRGNIEGLESEISELKNELFDAEAKLSECEGV